MFSIACGFFGDTPDAEDAVSEAVERILRNLDKFGEVPSPCARALCAVIAKNVCRDILRKKKRLPQPEDGPPDVEEDGDAVSPSAETAWFSTETVEGVKRCISALPDDYADILRLKMACDLTPREIAQTLGISDGNARIRLHRARAALIERMKEEGVL
jgi:RNA polymerase sigma-70 factor (ECF subfamily)